jgi:molybdate transport system substrate-binding protein
MSRAGRNVMTPRLAAPRDLQEITVFSAGIATVSKEPETGKTLIGIIASSAARDALTKSGRDPIAAGATT